MKKIFLLLIIVSILITGCGGPRMQVDPAWVDAPENISVLMSAPYVKNMDDVNDDFSTEDIFKTWLLDYMGETFNLKSVSNATVKMVDDSLFIMQSMLLGNGYVNVPLPNAENNSRVSGIVLSLHPINFWRDSKPCLGNGGCINNHYLGASLLYSIVSVENGKVLAYGVAYDESSFTFAMTKGNWEGVVKGLVNKVLEKTPLEK